MTTPTEKDAMALAVLDELHKRFSDTIPTPMNRRGESTMRIEHFVDLAHEAKQARAHLASRIAELEAENERAWAAANRADAKVRGWEATVVCTGLPFRACSVDGWGPGADGTVEVPALTTEKLTSILDRLARAEAAWLVEVQFDTGPRWWTGAKEFAASAEKWTPDSNKAVRFCREQDAEAAAKGIGGKAFASEHLWIAQQPGEVAVTDEMVEAAAIAWMRSDFTNIPGDQDELDELVRLLLTAAITTGGRDG